MIKTPAQITPNRICGSFTCTSDVPMHSHLSMPDPCPHITRLDYIAARISGDAERLAILTNCEDCNNALS